MIYFSLFYGYLAPMLRTEPAPAYGVLPYRALQCALPEHRLCRPTPVVGLYPIAKRILIGYVPPMKRKFYLPLLAVAADFALGNETFQEGTGRAKAKQTDKADWPNKRNRKMKTYMMANSSINEIGRLFEHDPRALKLNAAKQILMGLVLAAAWAAPNRIWAAGPAPIDLKTAAHFMILATATTTTTGGGYIDGDVGLSPLGSQGIPEDQINGTIYNGGPVTAQAQLDLNDAIIAASPAQLPGGIDAVAELGEKILVAGVYKSPSGAYDITSVDLTLDGGPDDVWVFQMASTLTVGVGRQVILTGGAQAKNIFWQVGRSATLGTSSVFKGTIMAYASITMNASSTLDGRALAQVGAVTFNGTGGRLPIPMAPVFTNITATATNCTMILRTTPDFLLTL